MCAIVLLPTDHVLLVPQVVSYCSLVIKTTETQKRHTLINSIDESSLDFGGFSVLIIKLQCVTT